MIDSNFFQNIDIFTIATFITRHGFFLLGLVLATRFISKAITKLLESRAGDENSVSLLNNILIFIVHVLAVLMLLSHFDISIAPILTAMGVGGMGVMLGLQETLQNIFSGIWLIISKQIRAGDFILLSNNEQGRVTDITWRYTTVQSVMGNLIVIPNKNLASSIITNYNLPYKDITIKIPIGVSYDSDLEQVERVTLEVANKIMQEMEETSEIPPKVLFNAFDDSAITFNVLLHSAKFETQLQLKHNFIKAITARFRQEGIDIPYPIRTVIQEKK